MKKIVSLLLALVMVLSLGVAAFAVDAEDANTTTTEEATPTVTLDQILEWIKGTIMPEINMDLMKEVIKQTHKRQRLHQPWRREHRSFKASRNIREQARKRLQLQYQKRRQGC